MQSAENRPSERNSKSCLVLVSAGARLLRLKKEDFTSTMSEAAVEHAKMIATQTM